MLVLASLVLVPAIARAQSAFTGTVKDTSGAVMPGVTVEAASPVLIEKVKSAITDENGQYRIVDLRPGTYTLTFTLPGFNTQSREGIELQSNFTATIDVQLSVGTLQESVTVSGASPVVDVQSNVKQQVLSREVLDAVPTAKTIQGLGQLVLGVTLNAPDVGGSRAMQQTYFAIRGTGGAQSVVLVDGLMTNGLMGDGAVQAYHNEAMSQEMVYQTAGGAAETLTGGITMNLVPKDGGNQFRGGAKWARSPASWQGDNLTQRLKDMGVTGVDRIDHFEEFNIEQGGPIVRNRLWFFGAFRQAYYDKPIANTFMTDGSLPYPQAYARCAANPGSCEQGISDEKMANPVARFTWQVSERNKFAVYMDRALRLRGHAMGALTDPRTASVIWNTPTFATGSAKWTSTLSSRLLLETGFSFNRERYDNLYQPGIFAERGTPAWYRNVRKDDISTGFLWNASGAQLGNYPDRYNVQGALSYVSGAHNVKVGAMHQWGYYRRYNNANADLYQTYQNGVPLRVTVLNTPLEVQENLGANFGVYAQDQWNMGKLTLNYGLRFDYLHQYIVGQGAQVGRFANIAPYDDIHLPKWKDFSPRVSAVYNLSGDGKTAIRAGYNKFVTAQTTGFAQLYNPTALTTQQLAWTDVNGNDIADGERGCVGYPTIGCEINFAGLPANFGVRSLAQFDPGLKRPYQLAFNAGITHELFSGFTASFEYFRSDFRNITVRQNSLRTAASYDQFSIVSPLDGKVVPVWLPKPGVASQVANVDSTSDDMKRWYNGFDLSFNARMRGGIRAFGGFSVERSLNDVCVAAQSDPNRSLYCNQAESGIPWQKQVKATVVYPLPWQQIAFSVAYQGLNGYLAGTAAQAYGGFTAGTGFDNPRGLGTHWLVTPTTRYAANCQAPCTPGALVLPAMAASGIASIQVPLVAPETEYTPRINQIDFSVSKSVEFGAFRVTPKLDLFNALNSDDYTSVSSTQFGAATYMRPSVILQGRIIRVGADVRW
ncbi:MAG TPA: carboxypeptidase regulatory-like domain-containing protein [Vicinamibacterales bacterium]|nr:carboxypeptidase regulatory-like domain-containing protein [Vicinamibacterales bacterium]